MATDDLEKFHRYAAQTERRLRRAIQDLQCLQASRNHGVPPVYDAVRYSMTFTPDAEHNSDASREEIAENRGFDQTNSQPGTRHSLDIEPAEATAAREAAEPALQEQKAGPSLGERLTSTLLHPSEPPVPGAASGLPPRPPSFAHHKRVE